MSVCLFNLWLGLRPCFKQTAPEFVWKWTNLFRGSLSTCLVHTSAPITNYAFWQWECVSKYVVYTTITTFLLQKTWLCCPVFYYSLRYSQTPDTGAIESIVTTETLFFQFCVCYFLTHYPHSKHVHWNCTATETTLSPRTLFSGEGLRSAGSEN